MSMLKQWFCSHVWLRWGSGYDSSVKCENCGKVKDEEPGDICSH